jgi:tetratricopeptide (TPR) repeat protein/tRNA A-37 threonylcarbamoyl transferase component Bud32
MNQRTHSLPAGLARRLNPICDDFEKQWLNGSRPQLEDFLDQIDPSDRLFLLRELLALELHYRSRAGEQLTVEEYRQRLPEHATLIEELFAPATTGREESSSAEPPTTPQATPRTDHQAIGAFQVGHYEVETEIARGGMAEVWRARDLHLRRALAIKVLQARFRGQRELELRFREEAQITGQLQHPGIPPVHEVGTLPDGRPFLAMKLIQGRTLADLLKERPRGANATPLAADLPQFLGIFEQVCQAVAYAHSKRVIHRDLKPANIMVGRFGEVQVLDWGLAKLMRPPEDFSVPSTADSESILDLGPPGEGAAISRAGRALGTPAFMPPEQACGRLNLVDERADVFSLGAILCVLLTGQPPYPGGNVDEVLLRAQRGDLAEAQARLEQCGADGELVSLCRQCLAVERADRPRDAEVVAARVTTYLAGVQERLRQAELDRAAAQAKAREERKRRRLSLVLAGAVVVVLLLGITGAVYRQQERQQGREQAQLGLAHVTELRKDYRFEDAEKLLDQVDAWVRQAADNELREELHRARTDLALAKELDQVRQEAGALVEGRWAPSRAAGHYHAVLSRHDLDVLGAEREALVRAIRASAVWPDIVAALDDWAYWEKDRSRRRRVLEIAAAADDPEPWRQEVRAAVQRGDKGRLKQLAARADTAEPTPGTVLLLTGPLGDDRAARRLLERMQERYPRDFWVHFNLGNWLHKQKEYRAAVTCWQILRTLRPRGAVVHYNLGVLLRDQGDVEGAIRSYREAIRLDSGNVRAHINLGLALRANGDIEGAVRSYGEALRLDPSYARPHLSLGNALHDKRDREGAIRSYREAIRLDPKMVQAHFNLGNVLRDKGDVEGAIRSYREAIRLAPKLARAHTSLGNALNDKGDREGAIRSYREAISLDPKDAHAHTGLGNALRDKGDVEGAIRSYREAIRLEPTFVLAHYNLGFVLHARGDLEGAIRSYVEAIRLDPKDTKVHTNLGFVLRDKGDAEGAIRSFREAIRLEPRNAKAHNNLGTVLGARGDLEGAIRSFREAIRLDPRESTAHYNLGYALRARGDVEGAIQSYREAIRLEPRDASAHYNLGNALKEKGDVEGAIRSFREAIRLDPKLVSAHGGLGQSLLRQGHFRDAQEALRRFQQLLPPGHRLRRLVAQLLEQCQQWLDLEPRLNAVLQGQPVPEDPATRVQLAAVAQLPTHQHFATSATLYAGAFDQQPSLLLAHRYNAACSAAQAGCGKSKEAATLNASQRLRWRRQALTWLHAELAALGKQLASSSPGQAGRARQALEHWRRDTNLACVRDRDALDRLPAEERERWQQLWQRVAELLKSTSKVENVQANP